MSDTPRILICDDEAPMRRMLADYLNEAGFDIDQAANANGLKAAMQRREPDLVLLDVCMPGQDGLSALRELRDRSGIPVIMLTAAGEIVDKILGLEFGADDYLVKPVDLRELQARIKAALRRSDKPGGGPQSMSELKGSVPLGDCTLDLDSAKLTTADGTDLPLTAMEFDLLHVFVRNRGRVLNRDQLLEGAHAKSWEPFDRSIDLRISRLRRKIEKDPSKPKVIRTVRGLGYVLE